MADLKIRRLICKLSRLHKLIISGGGTLAAIGCPYAIVVRVVMRNDAMGKDHKPCQQ